MIQLTLLYFAFKPEDNLLSKFSVLKDLEAGRKIVHRIIFCTGTSKIIGFISHTVNSSDWTLKRGPFPILPFNIAKNS